MRSRIMTEAVSVIALMAIMGGTAWAQAPIEPTDPDILYTGRWDHSNPTQPWCYWMGSSIIVNFEGSSCSATMSAGWSSNQDYLRVIVDGDAANSTKISVWPSTSTYLLASGLDDGVHKLEIIKETDEGYWTLNSLQLDDGKQLVDPPPRPARKISFYGDSNLAGSSLESELNQGWLSKKGSYRGYAGITSRMFGAEYENVSRGGLTIIGLHQRYDRIDYWNPNPVWDFSDFQPDVVVVNIGANSAGEGEAVNTANYHALLDDLRSVYPTAHIMLYNGWGWDYDEPANYIEDVITERSDPNMSFAIFPWIFEQWHGCEYDHAGMAQTLADHLAAVMGWTAEPIDVMNGYAMYGEIANGSFEDVAPFGGYGWRYYTDAGVSRVYDPAEAFHGDYYLQLSGGATSHQPIPAQDGEVFTITVWMRGASDGDEVAITMDFRDQQMWTTPLQSSTETHVLTTEWQPFSMTATAPQGTSNPVFHTRVTFTSVAGDSVDIDGVTLSDCDGDGIADATAIEMGLVQDCNDNGIPDSCDIADGTEDDDNGNGIPDDCECDGDITGPDEVPDGQVNVLDLLAIIGWWGSGIEQGDIDGNGIVDVSDLLAVLNAWGNCD